MNYQSRTAGMIFYLLIRELPRPAADDGAFFLHRLPDAHQHPDCGRPLRPCQPAHHISQPDLTGRVEIKKG